MNVCIDLHCHSVASSAAHSPDAMPECATTPGEVYELAKRRGMDFVTITDHNTIAGALTLADRPDAFVSEELTAWFKDEPQAVHVLCYGITPDDHDWLQAHQRDVVACAEYLHGHEIACALAHPFYDVAAPLTARHRRMLARLFRVWETRNGKRPPEMNGPAATYVETHGAIAVAGSDDHGGVDIGRTYTEAAPASSPEELLAHIRAGRVSAHGEQGSAAKLAHGAIAIAARALGDRRALSDGAPDVRWAERILSEGDRRHGNVFAGLELEARGRLLLSWLKEMELELDTAGLLHLLQSPDHSHADLERRARRIHERKLAAALQTAAELPAALHAGGDHGPLAAHLFTACVPALPYLPAATFVAHQRSVAMTPATDEPLRIAVISDGPGHDGGRLVGQLREHGIPGHELDVIGTGAAVDRRLTAVGEPDAGPGLGRGAAPTAFAMAEALTERRYEAIHVGGAGPCGVAALLVAQMMGVRTIGTYQGADPRLAGFYERCRLVLSPSPASDRALEGLGIGPDRVVRWQPGVDHDRFNPARYSPEALNAERFNVLYSGPLSREHGIELLAEAFLVARDRDPRLHLVLAGHGPAQLLLQARLGSAATFLGALGDEPLAEVFASADLLVSPGASEHCPEAILEAQASGLPVLAVDAGGATELINSGRSGSLVPADPDAMAMAIRGLSRRAALRERLSTGGLLAVRARSWRRSLAQLAEVYGLARIDGPVSARTAVGTVARAA
jgi:glycosyltransferase involved in cell wall biosynthesis/predicted metal-dependent phosphoesterase TrpH